MPKIKLTEDAIKGPRIKAPTASGKQEAFWDTGLIGFGVIASGTTATKSYVVQRDLPGGKSRRITIAKTNVLPLADARERAKVILADFYRGIDPKQQRRAAVTLREVLDSYLAARKDNLRPASIRLYRLAVEQHLTVWLDTPLAEITAEMVEARHRDIAAEVAGAGRHSGTTMANVALRVFRIVYNFAAMRATLPPNPVRRLQRQWYKEPRRKRLVSVDDLPKFYAAACALPNPVARDYLLLMMFSGMRRSEAAALKWENVDFRGRIIRVAASRTKTGEQLDLPMSSYVAALLIARRAIGDVGGFIFPANSATGHITDTMRPLAMIEKATGIRISAHDLRRTYTTVAESCDISPYALKGLINHTLGSGVTEGYIGLSTTRLREAAQKVCDEMLKLCGVEVPAGENVAKLG